MRHSTLIQPPARTVRQFSDSGPRAPRAARLWLCLFAASIVWFQAGCGGGSSTNGTTGGSTSGSTSGTTAGSTSPDIARYAATGSMSTTTTSAANWTIFQPSSLGAAGVTYPVILWGNGTATDPTAYQALLAHLASHGFIVVAANTANAGDGSQMLDGLTYLSSQNSTSGSPFYNHVDVQHVGACGHSQGGAGAIMAGRDARVSATAPLEPYILPIPGGGTFLAAAIGQQQGPMLLMSP